MAITLSVVANLAMSLGHKPIVLNATTQKYTLCCINRFKAMVTVYNKFSDFFIVSKVLYTNNDKG